jgi:hypothetical protein
MMHGFADEETEAFYRTGKTKAGYQSVTKVVFRKLDMLDAAKILDDLRVLPATSWRSFGAIAMVSTASASTTSRASAFDGQTLGHLTLRLSTTTERAGHVAQAKDTLSHPSGRNPTL